MSQQDLERHSGIPQQTIHLIETGQRGASIMELSALADACGVPVGVLRGTGSLSDQVLCAGWPKGAGAAEFAGYLVYAFGLEQRLDELGVSRRTTA